MKRRIVWATAVVIVAVGCAEAGPELETDPNSLEPIAEDSGAGASDGAAGTESRDAGARDARADGRAGDAALDARADGASDGGPRDAARDAWEAAAPVDASFLDASADGGTLCGLLIEVSASGTYAADTCQGVDRISTACGGGGVPEIVFHYTTPGAGISVPSGFVVEGRPFGSCTGVAAVCNPGGLSTSGGATDKYLVVEKVGGCGAFTATINLY